MRMSIRHLDELYKLLTQFEKDETIKRIIATEPDLQRSIEKVKETVVDIIV